MLSSFALLGVASLPVIAAAAGTGEPQTWIDFVSSGGVIGIFVLLCWLVLKRKLVPGWTYDAMEADRDYYRDLAHKGTDLATRQMDIAEALMERLETRSERDARLRAAARDRRSAEDV